MTPIRAALEAPTHAEANAISTAATGKGTSQQAYRLGPKILEVDTWVRSTDLAVIEVHPDVSFASIIGRPLEHRKTTWTGVEARRAILETVAYLPSDVGEAGDMAGVDDVLDAADSLLHRGVLRGGPGKVVPTHASRLRRRAERRHLGLTALAPECPHEVGEGDPTRGPGNR